MVPLDLLRAGEWADIATIDGDPAVVGRLAALGLQEGCRLRVVQPGSTCVLQVAECRLCLRAGECSRILVVPVTGPA